MSLTVGSLFSGIGGIDLGLERAGMKVLWQCEKDAWCRKILAKHWPEVPKYEDVQTLDAQTVESVDVLAGGFPCQDLSVAVKQAGILKGARSGLWGEFARLICALRPQYVFVENVPGLLIQPGLGIVLRDLACCGYDAEWQVLSAAAFGANHLRKRVWIVAYPKSLYASGEARELRQEERRQGTALYGESSRTGRKANVANAKERGLEGGRYVFEGDHQGGRQKQFVGSGGTDNGWWNVEPDLGRVAHGVPSRVDRLRGLGNAVVPQVVEWIGERIVDSHNS